MFSESWANLDTLFRPRAIAILGVSNNPEKQGFKYLKQLSDFGFPGKLYPVNPRGGEILGYRVYTSLSQIPEPVDYVISAIPAPRLLEVIEECAGKGVRLLQLYTAQLSETGDPEAVRLEREIVARARQFGIRVLGPNCMGLYYPKAGLTFRFNTPKESGRVGFISQSAGNAAEVIYRGAIRGLRFSKAISYGNAADINETELIEYLCDDPDTEIIAAYIEGVRDKRFPQVLKRAASRKPVILLKAGKTEAGARAVASHTASLAGNYQIWQAAVKQSGAIEVDSVEELVDTLLAFYFLPRPEGRNAGVIGAGGGGSTLISDHLERLGIRVPPLPQEIQNELKTFLGDDWIMIRNPVDTSVVFPAGWTYEELRRIFKLIADHPQYHILIADTGEWVPDAPWEVYRLQNMVQIFLDVAHSTTKPFIFVIRSAECPEEWRWQAVMAEQLRCAQAGYPVFTAIPKAARALHHFINYHLKDADWASGSSPSPG